MIQINNARSFALFISVLIGGSLLNTLTIIFGWYQGYWVIIPYTMFILVFGSVLLIRPNYIQFQFRAGILQISSGINSESVLEIRKDDFANYKIESSLFGYVHTLYLFRKVNKGYLKSRPIRISLITDQQLSQIKEGLDRFGN